MNIYETVPHGFIPQKEGFDWYIEFLPFRGKSGPEASIFLNFAMQLKKIDKLG